MHIGDGGFAFTSVTLFAYTSVRVTFWVELRAPCGDLKFELTLTMHPFRARLKDVEVLDTTMPMIARSWTYCVVASLAALAVCTIVSWYFGIACLPLIVIYLFVLVNTRPMACVSFNICLHLFWCLSYVPTLCMTLPVRTPLPARFAREYAASQYLTCTILCLVLVLGKTKTKLFFCFAMVF